MNKVVAVICAMFCLVGCEKESAAIQPLADAVYDNGRFWTGDPGRPWVGSIAILDGKIAAVGDVGGLEAWRGDATEYQDLKGRLVTPGFQDSHIHIMYKASPQVDLAGAQTLDELQQRILDFSETNPDVPWVVGFGWAYSAFPDQRPLASHLDAVVPDRPVFVSSRDGHMALANSMAMQIASIDESTQDPENGRIVRTKSGLATGEFQETAKNLVSELIPPPTEKERYLALIANMQAAAAEGITAFHEAGVAPENIGLFEKAEAEGHMLQRAELALRMVTSEDKSRAPVSAAKTHIAEAIALRNRLNGPFVRVRSIKGMLDGTIDATTAGMFEEYVGTDTTGIRFWEPENLKTIVALYDDAGFQVILHAIGDRTIADALDAFENAKTTNGARDSRHRVEHAEMPRVADLARFRELSVIASTQPMFAYPDATVLENFTVLLGHDRAKHADNFALWDDAGVRQVFGSDHPVMTLSVMKGIEAAVTRMTDAGNPPGGWYPEGRISVDAALRHYTVDAAWGTHDDQDRGTLQVGKFADFVVLSQNIFDIDPTEISETAVLKTVMNGRVTFNAKSAHTEGK
ncbi:MAG: amidohydrolase [Pseudomonadota bacterium]